MNVAVSWSGGKDSGLAYYKTLNEGFNIELIVTFLWEEPAFYHLFEVIPLQAKALGVPHLFLQVKKPYLEGYREALMQLAEKQGIEGVVTGDSAFIDSFHGDWMKKVLKATNIRLIRPLWGMKGTHILEEFISCGFRAIFTYLKKPWFNKEWLGKELNSECLESILNYFKEVKIDPAGEKGEYHTTVIDGPLFKKSIEIIDFDVIENESAVFMKPKKCQLKPK